MKAASAGRRPSTFAALAHRDFRLMWTGYATVNVGGTMQAFASGWLVVQLALRDGDPHLAPLYLGLTGFTRAIPGVIFGLFAGVLADRIDRRRLLLTTQSASCVLSAILAILTLGDWITFPEILVIGTLSAIVGAFDSPTRLAMLPRLVPKHDLMSAVGLVSTANQVPALVGPFLGGVLIGPIGIGGIFTVHVVSYAAILGALVALPPQPASAEARRGNPLAAMAEGLAYAARNAYVLSSLLVVTALALLVRPVSPLLPAFTTEILGLGAVELSWLLGVSGAGMLVGSLITASLGNVRRELLQPAGVVCTGLLLVLFSFQTTLAGALVVIVVLSAFLIVSSGMTSAQLQSNSSNEFVGRVMSLYSITFSGVIPLGLMLVGTLGSFVGTDRSLTIAGGLAAGIAGVLLILATRLPASRAETEALAPTSRA